MDHLHFFGIHLFYYMLVAAFLLPRIPVVGKFFNIINTLIHELGHALMSLLLQGKVSNIKVFQDTSGVTTTQSNSKFKSTLVSLAGYPFASVMAFVCFFLLSVGYEKWILVGLTAIFLIMLIFWIRNWYGAIWVLVFTLINIALLYFWRNDTANEIVAWFYSMMILVESVWSTWVLVWLSAKTPDKAGDATNLHKFAYLPAIIWAVLFALFALVMAYLSLVKVSILTWWF